MSSLTNQIIERMKELRDQTRHYGLIMGGTLITLELAQYWQHNSISIASASFLFIFKVATMFIVARYLVTKIKEEFFKTGMSYGQSFSIIFRLFLYGSLLAGLFSFILNKWLAPDYLSEVLAKSIEMLKSYIDQAQLPTAQADYVDTFIEDLEESPIPSPLTTMWSLMWSYMIWGAFVGAILSIFTRDKDINPLAQQEDTDN
ncbi:MAG: DUF4199 domain-containing protein [Bacteroidales bacterium]|jgi:hypothetical protein|nr:DUF4199 domain-containing protein [Bacteroidales bacterium]